MEAPTLIYCGGGNPRFARIAVESGLQYGVRYPSTVYERLYFADIDWKNPDKERYLQFLSKQNPHIATVLDMERIEQYDEVLSWAEEAADFIGVIIIVPKVHDIIRKLPRRIRNKEVRLGYSVPTKYGSTNIMLAEFEGRPVHLLGGAPHKQYELSYYLNVRSVDVNMMQKMATQKCAFFDDKKMTRRGYWPRLKDVGLGNLYDAPYKAFEISCKNIMRMWKEESFLEKEGS